MCGYILGITFNVNSQVLIDLYRGNSGFRLSFKPNLTKCSHHSPALQTAEKSLVHVETMPLPAVQVLLALQTQKLLPRIAQM